MDGRSGFGAVAFLVLMLARPCAAQPVRTIDLATEPTDTGRLLRLYGSVGDGHSGIPVAGGRDCNGDGKADYAMASMLASVTFPGQSERMRAGIVYLVFGDGTISGTVDTASMQAGVLAIAGDGDVEMTGSEIWMDDVTGDGVGDLLIGRQNFSPDASRIGAGALTIIAGGSQLSDQAATLSYLDLRDPPPAIPITTLVGVATTDRLGIWLRTGDVDGDGIDDIVVGADQEDSIDEVDRGAVYVVRGGSELSGAGTIDLAEFPTTVLAGGIAKVLPPTGAIEYHFGSTCAVGDLDDDGRAEVVASAALTRAGAAIGAPDAPLGSAHAVGGSTDGTVFIVWDENFPSPPWPAGLTIDLSDAATVRTVIDGGTKNVKFGEELIVGRDWDDDGHADLFAGDIVGDLSPAQDRMQSGAAHVLYDAASLKGLEFDLDAPPQGLVVASFMGANAHDIAGDTAIEGDFNGDGIDDLAFSSPHGGPLNRLSAGILHVFFGGAPWPALTDLAADAFGPATGVRAAQIYGGHGTNGGDDGDTLCYSGASGDVDGDGRDDIITNEMLGNGVLPAAEDVGNLVVVSGASLCVPGDCNGNGALDAADPICTVLCLVGAEPPGADCRCAADCNCSGDTGAADPVCSVLRTIGAFTPDLCIDIGVCGDGLCDRGESCSICSDDCGACPGS